MVFPQRPRPPPHVSQGGPAPAQLDRGRGRCACPPVGVSSPPAATARRPGAQRPPRPLLFVTARLPVCGRRPRLTSRAGKPPKATSFSETLLLGPASCLLRIPPPSREPAPGGSRGKGGTSGGCRGGTAGRSPGTRGRCAAAQAAVLLEVHGTALATTGDQSSNPESACVSAS